MCACICTERDDIELPGQHAVDIERFVCFVDFKQLEQLKQLGCVVIVLVVERELRVVVDVLCVVVRSAHGVGVVQWQRDGSLLCDCAVERDSAECAVRRSWVGVSADSDCVVVDGAAVIALGVSVAAGAVAGECVELAC